MGRNRTLLMFAAATALCLLLVAISPAGRRSASAASPRPVYVVLFTHIEDATPTGVLGTPANRASYLNLRARLLEMGAVAKLHGVRWSLEPDWKFLLAAQQYEDTALMSTTEGVNIFRYLRDVLGVAIDPHSHEGSGYNYTDVAYLLETLGVGGSAVIGGHIWDPSLPQFAEWDRFREPVRGRRYPMALWRGEILMGSGTPNHVNDPTISGIWRPKDRHNYFTDDPAGNIACVGAFRGNLEGIAELAELYRTERIGGDCMLTSTFHIRPSDLLAASGPKTIEDTVIRPLAELRDTGDVVPTDFTALVATWKEEFGGRACTVDFTPGHLAAPSQTWLRK
jgi:hypothetical protein